MPFEGRGRRPASIAAAAARDGVCVCVCEPGRCNRTAGPAAPAAPRLSPAAPSATRLGAPDPHRPRCRLRDATYRGPGSLSERQGGQTQHLLTFTSRLYIYNLFF